MRVDFLWDDSRRMGAIRSECLDDIKEAFSVANPDARFARSPFVPARKYAITPTGRFDVGILYEIIKACHKLIPGVEIKIQPELYHQIAVPYNTQVYEKLKLELRYYQKEIIQKCLAHGRGTVVLATAGGKTLTMAGLIATIHQLNPKLKALIIVPDVGLVHQTYSDFTDYGVPFTFSKWTGKDALNLGTNVIISNLGLLHKTKSDKSWLEDIDLLIIDEVHKLRKGNEINNLIKNIRTPHRFGLTGTLPENMLDQWNIIGKMGPLLYEKTSVSLEKEKYVAPVKAIVLRLHYHKGPDELPEEEGALPAREYRHEMDFIRTSKFRNRVISSVASKLDNNCLILVDYIEHGDKLYEILKENCLGKQIFFIRGEVEVEDRRKVIEMMENQKDVVCVAISKIFATGINIKRLCYIIFASAGKAKIKTIQSIGRGRRLHADKVELVLLDIADQLEYGTKHLQSRLKLYKGEQIPFAYKDVYEKVTDNLPISP